MKKNQKISLEEIEEKALRGEDVNSFFSNGKKKPPLCAQTKKTNRKKIESFDSYDAFVKEIMTEEEIMIADKNAEHVANKMTKNIKE